MDSQKKKLIYIGGIVGVVILLLIIIFILIANSNNPKEQVQPQEEQQVEVKEVSLEEIQLIKDYLKRYAYVAILARDTTKPNTTHEEMSSDLAMVYMATKNTERTQSTQPSTTTESNAEGDSRLSMDIDTNNTIENTVTNFPTTQSQTNVFGLSEEEIQKAVFEMFGSNIDNLTQILMTETTSRELSEVYIKDIQDVTCVNGIYSIRFDACLETPAQQSVGTNVFGLDAYTIQVKLEKNEEFSYNEYRMTKVDVVSEITPMAYHISYSNGKYGVIDNNGNVILDNRYSNVYIPNNYVGLFMCYDETSTIPTFINERVVQQFKEYDNVELLEATGSEGIKWNESDIIIVEKDGLYGAVNYLGTVIYDTKYDKITPLGYFPELIVLELDGSKALADTKGNILSDFDYTKIGIGGIDMDANALLTPSKTQEEATKLLAENDYIIGLSTAGIYTIVKTMPKEPHMIMSPYAKEYTMTIGTSWQLALGTDGVTPVYMRTQAQPVEQTQQTQQTQETQQTIQ